MNRPARILAGIATAGALALGSLAIATPAEAAPKGCPVSKAWQHASKAERKHATKAYLKMAGSWNNGSKADLRHSYQGTTRDARYVVPYVPVLVIPVKGADVLILADAKKACL